MTWRRSFRLDSTRPDAQHAAFVPALVIPAETPPMAPPASSGQMVIIVGKDRRVIVDASVDTTALARVLLFWSEDDPGPDRRADLDCHRSHRHAQRHARFVFAGTGKSRSRSFRRRRSSCSAGVPAL